MNASPLSSPQAVSSRALLELARERQLAMARVFRFVALAGLLIVEASGVNDSPAPGLSGGGLAITLALVGFGAGTLGGVVRPYAAAPVLAAFLGLLVVTSGVLLWLHPGGAAVLGLFIAVAAASLRLPRRESVAIASAAGVALALPVVLTTTHSVAGALLNGAGLLAFYAMGELAGRLREGQDLARRLLVELEESQQARADAAALAERQRVAREMHDVLAHSLSGLVLQLEAARLLARRSAVEPELAGTVERALHLGKTGLAEARRAIGMLRGDDLPGPEALRGLVSDFEHDAGIRCAIEISGPVRTLEPAAGLTLYRVAQEALTNARRHARPERVEVRLVYEPGGTRLTVEDYEAPGAVPLVQADATGGYGITGMRERAELLGGRLDATPTGSGFRVELWVPA